jgi:hypothetical protein
MNSLFLMRALSPITLSHSIFLSHSIWVCSSLVVRIRSPLKRPQIATTCPFLPILLSYSMSSRFVRMSMCPSLETMISLLCQPRTGLMTIVVGEEGEKEALATAAYDGFCYKARVLLSTFEESYYIASWSVRIAFAIVCWSACGSIEFFTML